MSINTDLKNIENLPLDKFNSIMELFIKKDKDKIFHLKEFSEDNNVQSLIRMIEFASVNFIESDNFDREVKNMDEFIQYVTGKELSENKGWSLLRNKFKKLVPFILDEKVTKLQEKLVTYESIEVITNIRPVFDINKESVNTLIFPSSVLIKTNEGTSISFEIYENQIKEVIDKLNTSLRKIKTLRESYE
ncbi:hypothetical protein [Marinicella meishanensis]|uniref:hypothetical protein n=1 Tax=Marinicella meishanensis TaxID=2873263 RepID=UPI001CBED555|nr:hypothetical protein [Marinicella sp. NBU2979]